MQIKLSVIIPVYNIEKYIGECIDSVINQNYTNIEIILVDDGSTDKSGIICDQYGKIDSRIRVIHKNNGGLVSARKAGLNLARGEYVAYVDGDDWIGKEWFEKAMDYVMKYRPEMVLRTGYTKSYDNVRIEVNYESEDRYIEGKELQQEIIQYFINTNKRTNRSMPTGIWSYIFSSEVLRDAQFKVRDTICVMEDIAVLQNIVFDVKTMMIVNTMDYYYRQRSDSIMHERNSRDYSGLVELLDGFKATAIRHPELERLILGKAYFCIVTGVMFIIKDYKIFEKLFALKGKKKIAIYGAGVLGNGIVKAMQACGDYEIVAWYDKRLAGERRWGIEIQSVNNIKNNYDVILIAVNRVNMNLYSSIKEQLLGQGVKEEKMTEYSIETLSEKDVLKIISDIQLLE